MNSNVCGGGKEAEKSLGYPAPRGRGGRTDLLDCKESADDKSL